MNTKSIIKLWVIVVFMLQACVQTPYTPALDNKGRPYSAANLAKDLRDKSHGKNPMINYPADNDEDYNYPKFPVYTKTNSFFPSDNGKGAVPVKKPVPGAVAYGDSEEDAVTGYPRYDPEEDNSGYYYTPHAKPLPKPVDDGSGNYTYPIYFDN
jgi:hypothetical protein